MDIIPQLFQYGVGIAAVCALLWFVASWTGNLNKGAVELASKAEAEAVVEYIRGTGVKARTDGSFKLDGVRRYRVIFNDRVDGLHDFLSELRGENVKRRKFAFAR